MTLLLLAWLGLPGAAGAATQIAETGTVKLLIDRALKKPDRVQDVQVGATSYKVYVVESGSALQGQDCPNGTSPKNALFVTKAVSGPGGDLYPLRLSATCASGFVVRDTFGVDADADGNVLDVSVYNGSLGLVVHPLQEPAPLAAGLSSLNSFLGRLVRLFLSAP